ncbi:MAG TPA: hypothetical protein VLK84_24550, partial [Longimicrobium sp.]|nr:hypothetical protein [Longimicrobium sp.]
MHARLPALPFLLFATLSLGVGRLAAQKDGEAEGTRDVPRRGWSVGRTMRAFLRAVRNDEPAPFFPRHGDWEYHTSLRDSTGARHPGVWRFSPADVKSAIALPNGPLCNEFSHGDGIAIPSIVYAAMEEPDTWRRTSATRYDVGLEVDDDQLWVRWRKEDARWVIDALGSIRGYIPSPPSTVAATRDTLRYRQLKLPLPDETRTAPAASWFGQGEPVTVDGHRLSKNGFPRTFRERELVTYTVYDGVPVYIAADDRDGVPHSVVYLPIDRAGTFQPY